MDPDTRSRGVSRCANPAACARVRDWVGAGTVGGSVSTRFRGVEPHTLEKSRRISEYKGEPEPPRPTPTVDLPRGRLPNAMASATASPWVQGIAAGRSLARSARHRPAPVRTRRPSPARWRITTSAGLLDALEVKVPKSSTAEDVDEKNEFRSLMEKAGVKHQVRLASGARGRGAVPHRPGRMDRVRGAPLRAPRRVHLRALRRR